MQEPSAQWTDEERLALIGKFAAALEAEASTSEVSRRRVWLTTGVIKLIAIMPSGFLELNRAQILEP